MQTPLSELETPLTFEWTEAAYMPFNMTDYPQVVVMGEKVYIGGRLAKETSSSQTVIVYDSKVDKWSTLPPYEWILFGMAAVNNQLVLIGGIHCVKEMRTAQLRVWNGKWTKAFTPMPTARLSPSAITYIKWLVVVGGRLERVRAKLSNVEILDTTSDQWYRCAPLPQPCSSISLSATVGNMCYALGGFASNHRGSTKAFSICLDDLISQAVSQPASASAPPTPSPWQALPDTPLKYSTAISVDGALFAVGGLENTEPSTSLHLYRPSSKNWVQLVGVLPHGRETCACAAIDRKILFAGGSSRSSFSNVDIAEIKYHTS